jgi:hypothetical protein
LACIASRPAPCRTTVLRSDCWSATGSPRSVSLGPCQDHRPVAGPRDHTANISAAGFENANPCHSRARSAISFDPACRSSCRPHAPYSPAPGCRSTHRWTQRVRQPLT